MLHFQVGIDDGIPIIAVLVAVPTRWLADTWVKLVRISTYDGMMSISHKQLNRKRSWESYYTAKDIRVSCVFGPRGYHRRAPNAWLQGRRAASA